VTARGSATGVSPDAQMLAIENLLRDEFADIERQSAGDRELPDA
jgi:hypothetical protein